MQIKIIGKLRGCDTAIIQNEDTTVSWEGKADIDGDGKGQSHGDPCYQSDTRLHFCGQALNSDKDYYVVAPPELIDGVEGIVIGCSVTVEYRGSIVAAVCGDEGPRGKAGEISIALATALGIPSSPIDGGVNAGVYYEFRPGVAAIAQGRAYQLSPSHPRRQNG